MPPTGREGATRGSSSGTEGLKGSRGHLSARGATSRSKGPPLSCSPSTTPWARAGGYDIDLDRPFEKLKAQERKLLFDGTSDFEGIDEFFEQLERKKYKLHIKVFTSRYKGQFLCKSCDGTRLNKDALFIKVSGLSIAEVNAMTIAGARGC